MVLDVVGREVGASTWVALRPHPQGSREWDLSGIHLVPWLAQTWSAPPIVRASGRTPAAPALCPHGLEVVTRRELFPPGASYERAERSTFAFDGVRGWQPQLVPQAATTAVVGFAPRADAPTLLVTLAAGVIASTADDRGPVFVTRSWASDEVRLQALDRDGGTRWSRPITPYYDYRVAVGGARVLTTSAHVALMPAPLSWTLLDAGTGAPVATTEFGLEALDAGAAAWVDGHFLVVWTAATDDGVPRSHLRVATFSADGVMGPRMDLPVRSNGAIDAVAAGSHVAVVSVDESRVLWTLLDPNGAVVRGPVAVSDGVGSFENWSPRVTFGDGLFAVAWQSSALQATYAAVVDLTGAVSPAVRLSGGVRSWTPGIAATSDRTFLATYATTRSGVDAVSLRCRATAPRGAPAFIGAPQ